VGSVGSSVWDAGRASVPGPDDGESPPDPVNQTRATATTASAVAPATAIGHSRGLRVGSGTAGGRGTGGTGRKGGTGEAACGGCATGGTCAAGVTEACGAGGVLFAFAAAVRSRFASAAPGRAPGSGWSIAWSTPYSGPTASRSMSTTPRSGLQCASRSPLTLRSRSGDPVTSAYSVMPRLKTSDAGMGMPAASSGAA
jgi:hypothetical protein